MRYVFCVGAIYRQLFQSAVGFMSRKIVIKLTDDDQESTLKRFQLVFVLSTVKVMSVLRGHARLGGGGGAIITAYF